MGSQVLLLWHETVLVDVYGEDGLLSRGNLEAGERVEEWTENSLVELLVNSSFLKY